MKASVNSYKMNSTRILMIVTLVIALVFCIVVKGFSQPVPPDSTKGNGSTPMLTLQGLMSTNNGLADNSVIYFSPSASATFDGHTDATKLMNTDPGIPNIYTILDSVDCCVEGLPAITDGLIIPLGYEVQTDGSYTISASQLANFDSSVHIFLEDLALGTSQDLTINPTYNFIIHKVDKGGRFFLKFNITTGIEQLSYTKSYNVYSFDKNIHINYYNPEKVNATLSIYNIEGQKMTEKQIGNGSYNLNLNYAPGCYIVRMFNKTDVQTDKIYVK